MMANVSEVSLSNIYQVAKCAAVSTATVSRVLSRPDVVSPETRRRVMEAVTLLGYAPNSAAKNLRTLRTGKLLVTVPDISNPFFSLILQGIEDAAQREGYAVLLGDTQHDEEREERYALMLKRKEADGLIFLGHRLPKTAAALVRASRRGARRSSTAASSARRLGIPSVHIDNAGGGRRGDGPLYELGHRRIGIVTGPLVSPLSRDRLRGATARAQRSGPSDEFVVMHGDFSIESGRRRRRAPARAPTSRRRRSSASTTRWRWAPSRPRAAAACACRDDLSVVGFDDIRFAATRIRR